MTKTFYANLTRNSYSELVSESSGLISILYIVFSKQQNLKIKKNIFWKISEKWIDLFTVFDRSSYKYSIRIQNRFSYFDTSFYLEQKNNQN